jgi:SAM-dependent methyltransferase
VPESSENSATLRQTFTEWWKARVQERGYTEAGKLLFRELWEFVRDSTPDRHRQRYGDADYDWDFRVNTTSATVSFRDRLMGVFSSAYQPTDPAFFHEMICRLPAKFREFTFIDLGSGKGRTLLMASDYCFRRIIGVEHLPTLHSIAQENVTHYKSEAQQCFQLEPVCADARTFPFPLEPLVVYLFNPFPEDVLRQVVQNLKASLEQHPRPAYLIYHNAVLPFVIDDSGVFRKIAQAEHYSIYVSTR